MEEKTARLSLNISDGLHPKLMAWLESTPSRLRAAKILQYVETNLIADENGGFLRASAPAIERDTKQIDAPSKPLVGILPTADASAAGGFLFNALKRVRRQFANSNEGKSHE